MDPARDGRTVLTLDAGGTTFAFQAIRGNLDVAEPIVLPSRADDLQACLATLREGFKAMGEAAGGRFQAISFAFPGPADYAAGVILDLQNLPCFRGGVPLGAILEEAFGVPVLINNDGDLFAYGEALCGALPELNRELEARGNPRRFRNLLGLTLGTGFGAGIVSGSRLLLGDNSAAAEIWCTRNKLDPGSFAEEGVSIRAVRHAYARGAGIPPFEAPEPRDLARIADGELPGDRAAAREAFRRLGEVLGDAAADALTLVDGLVVLGGGLAGAARHFLPAMVAELNRPLGSVLRPGQIPRTELQVFNLEDPEGREALLTLPTLQAQVPGSARTVTYNPTKGAGVLVSRLGTARAVALGAYAHALEVLDR